MSERGMLATTNSPNAFMSTDLAGRVWFSEPPSQLGDGRTQTANTPPLLDAFDISVCSIFRP